MLWLITDEYFVTYVNVTSLDKTECSHQPFLHESISVLERYWASHDLTSENPLTCPIGEMQLLPCLVGVKEQHEIMALCYEY